MVIEKPKTIIHKVDYHSLRKKKFFNDTNLYNINLQNVHDWNFILTNGCHTVSILGLGNSCPLPISLVFLSFCNICQLLIHGWWAELDQ